MRHEQIVILALESSADETGAAILRGDLKTRAFHLQSNIVYTQIGEHRKTGGIVPEVAAREHLPKIIPSVQAALVKSKLALNDIDVIAVTAGPGLVTSLRIGVDTAKTLAYALEKPLIAVNHLEGHLLSALPKNTEFETQNSKLFPALGLIVSGGHTILVLVRDYGKYKILGETLDDAAGECFDKAAKILGLPYPGGPALAKLAEKGDPSKYDLPRPMLRQNNFNFSFSGLKTAVLYLHRDLVTNHRSLGSKIKADIAASVQTAIVEVLVEKTIRAAKEYKVKTILMGGGVAANKLLRKTLTKRIKKEPRPTACYLPPADLTTDNAGMIAFAGFWHYIHGDTVNFSKVAADPNLRLNSWR